MRVLLGNVQICLENDASAEERCSPRLRRRENPLQRDKPRLMRLLEVMVPPPSRLPRLRRRKLRLDRPRVPHNARRLEPPAADGARRRT